MTLRNFLTCAALTLVAGASQAWTLAYSHDATGAATSGSLETLRNAANNGASVKVLVSFPGVHTFQVPCANVSVRDDASLAVVCSNTTLRTDGTPGVAFGMPVSPPQSAHFVINTLGQYSHSTVRIGDGGLTSYTKFNQPMRWYIE